MQNEWSDPAMNLATNTRVAALPDGSTIGCVEVWMEAPYVSHWLWGRVDPAWRRRGAGTALMRWAEARVREQIDSAPHGARVTITAASPGDHQPTNDLLRDLGFVVVRAALTMERALDAAPPAPDWPEGVSVATMQPGQELEVFRAADESFADHHGHVDVPVEQGFPIWRHRMTMRPDFDPSLWFVAWSGGEIAGVALCFPARGGDDSLGWVSTLGVRRPWRRRGLGKALLFHAFGELRRRGRARVGLGVDAQSLTGATRLYEAAGMRAVDRWISFEKQLRDGHDLVTRELS
jgi:mycothiol synthase